MRVARPWRRRGSNLTLAIGGLLVGYLLLLIGASLLGQQQLRDALGREARFDLEKREAALSYFFAERRDDMAMLAEARALQNYFANRALGMSMAYGLRASLLGLREALLRVQQSKHVGAARVYRRITFYRPDGNALADTSTEDPQDLRWTAWDAVAGTPGASILLARTDNGPKVIAGAPVFHKGEPVGIVVGEIDGVGVLEALYPEGRGRGHWAFALYGPEGLDTQLVATEGYHDARARAGDNLLATPVSGTPLRLIGTGEPLSGSSYVASRWSLAALFLLAAPVSMGVWRLWRLNSHNLVLHTRMDAARRQRDALSERNALLQAEVAKRMEYEQLLARQANYDPLTELPNRNLALDRLAQAIKLSHRDQLRVLVMYVDLDHFKVINDSLGHGAGDNLLREAAARLDRVLRPGDTLARLGGDEFLLLFPELRHASEAEHLAGEVLEAMRPPYSIHGHESYLGASIGMAMCPDHGDTPEQLLKNADIALYKSKHQGRNRFHFFTPAMDADARERLALDAQLRHAIERDELRVVYQPLVDLRTRRLVGVEALLRWESGLLGNVSPADFIPLAEETGIIHELTRWVLDAACRAAAAWNRQHPLRLAVNISAREFVQPHRLLETIHQALAHSGLAHDRLELELTESLLVQASAALEGALQALDGQGIRLSVDDFGTGYSALSYLQRFPFDTLKIDRSFVQGVMDNQANAALVRAIIKMAEALGLETVAEGVETEDQARFLDELHCPLAQGYLFSRPVEAEQIDALIEREKRNARPRLLVGA